MILLALALGSAWLLREVSVRTAGLRFYRVPSASMAGTIVAGDRVGVSLRTRSDPRRGEVWIYRMPHGASREEVTAIKRVVAVPGDTVQVAGGRVVVNGARVSEGYVTVPAAYTLPSLRLGAGQYFVLGDNRNDSYDSHVWGPLGRERFVGRALFRYWPLGRIGGL